jgi:CRISPR/Cas system CMR-associated protein Cmr5 small subunit
MTSRNLDTLRAERATLFIAAVKPDQKADKKKLQEVGEIRQEIEALPARLRMNGLLQTLVYLLNKDKEDRIQVGKEIIDHLSGRFGISQPANNGYGSAAVSICSNHLSRATEEASAYVTWLKLMAKAELPKPNKEGTGDVTSEVTVHGLQ